MYFSDRPDCVFTQVSDLTSTASSCVTHGLLGGSGTPRRCGRAKAILTATVYYTVPKYPTQVLFMGLSEGNRELPTDGCGCNQKSDPRSGSIAEGWQLLSRPRVGSRLPIHDPIVEEGWRRANGSQGTESEEGMRSSRLGAPAERGSIRRVPHVLAGIPQGVKR